MSHADRIQTLQARPETDAAVDLAALVLRIVMAKNSRDACVVYQAAPPTKNGPQHIGAGPVNQVGLSSNVGVNDDPAAAKGAVLLIWIGFAHHKQVTSM